MPGSQPQFLSDIFCLFNVPITPVFSCKDQQHAIMYPKTFFLLKAAA